MLVSDMTYSILVVEDDLLGVGVVSGSVAIGSRVPFIMYPYCVIVSQGYSNPALGPMIADFIKVGFNAKEALNEALKKDSDPELRQIAVITHDLDKAVYTGEKVLNNKGEYVGNNFIVIGDLTSDKVINSIAEAFLSSEGELAQRILSALKAGHDKGGDLRGDKSAAIIIHGPTKYSPYYNVILDIRVDYSEDPLLDLEKILKMIKPGK